ncbi:MAG: sterol desaturase family protein [Kiloniellales bacterium]|nr:sterol desaturase family protein [Kiloniellales bacterium]
MEELLTWKGVVILAWLALLFAGERLAPAAQLPPSLRSGDETKPAWRRLGRNLGLWLLNVGLSPLVVLPVSYWASTQALGWRPEWWSGAGGLLLDLLLLDFLIYWWHRANHVVPFLWRFHQVHHLDRFLDTTSALRFHFGELLLSAAARAVIIVLLGIPFESILVFEALVLVATIFHHSNLRLPARLEKALSRVFVTPSIHWVHHHAVRRDTDSNYATVLSLWDPLFGSRSGTRRSADLEIGVEGRGELSLPRLLWAPFRSRAG